MIENEKSRYKSWSGLKKQMEDLLCDSLKDHISYFFTMYNWSHFWVGRGTINYDKAELIDFSWTTELTKHHDILEQYRKMESVPTAMQDYREAVQKYEIAREVVEKEKWMPNCTLNQFDFVESMTIYLKTDVSSSLNSTNYLLRVFAYMDRRVGKRKLVKIKDEVETLPDWVKRFYKLRCKAESIVFP